MKDSVKIFIILVVVILIANLCSSCTDNQRAKRWGGNMTINVEPGYEVMMATFKDDADMWYMVRKMSDDYVPTDKILIENSTWNVLEGRVTFHETRADNVAMAVLDSIPNTKAIKVEFKHRQ